jgi:glycerophosphoryl diester phosphodiesterase
MVSIYRTALLATLMRVVGAQLMTPRIASPQIVAHRGATGISFIDTDMHIFSMVLYWHHITIALTGYLPEHSIIAYELAMSLNADYIEPDLCLTKDNVFMVMHDLLLDDATDIIKFPEFADRVNTRFVDGLNMTGYFIDDFTQSELEKLTLRQRISGRSLNFDGIYKIPSFSEVMNLAQKQYNITGRTVGVYAEIKHPSYYNFRHGAHFMEDLLLIALEEGRISYIFHNIVPLFILLSRYLYLIKI